MNRSALFRNAAEAFRQTEYPEKGCYGGMGLQQWQAADRDFGGNILSGLGGAGLRRLERKLFEDGSKVSRLSTAYKLAEVLDAAAALLEGWNPPRYEQGSESNNSSSLFFADCARWLLDPQFSLPIFRRKK